MIRCKDGFLGERSFVLPKALTDLLKEHPLSAALHITDIGYYPRALHHYRERTSPIDQYIMIYCMEGSGWYEAKGVRREVGPDTVFVIPADTPHAYAADENDPWTIYWVHFRGDLASHYASDISVPVRLRPGPASRISDRVKIFEEIMLSLGNGFDFDNLLFASSAFHHFLGSIIYLSNYRCSRQDPLLSADIANAAVKYMGENIEKKLKIGDLSKYVGYSTSRFSTIFQESTGMSPMAYFNMLKIRHACELLVDTDMRVNQICYKVGISDMMYFSRLFSKFMGMPPSVYRTKMQMKRRQGNP